ncbi:MAG: serine/threonine protein kinase [Nocardioidaceae bacterium]|nr:serine/threonine protein kinase [Nocardioidaceae bacterium]
MVTQTRPPAEPSGSSTGAPEEGQYVGDYRLMALIGEGGMGVVHLAMAPDGRRVALKVLRPHVVGDAEARQRLAREVGSLRLISSPRVAEVLDADPHAATPYVATRYVPGLSLHEHVAQEGPIQGADLLHFARCLAEALVAVHSVGVLHRDIKPSNVLMEGRSPVLIDFGLARLAEDSRLTHTGWLLGTPGYLAPEILYGDDASPASDVHAWASTVAFAACGKPPFGKGPAMAVMDRVRRGEYDLSGVPEPLAGLLRSCLSPDPLDRPGLHEVLAWLNGQSNGGPPVESWTMPVVALERPPVQAPEPVTRDLTTHDPVPRGATRVLPQDPLPPTIVPVDPNDSPALRRGQLLGIGAMTAAAVAFAPYAGVALVAVLVLLARTASVGRERLNRRRAVRGGRRWFDLPTTAVASPGYVLLAAFGSLLLVGWAAAAAVAFGVLVTLLQPPLAVGMALVGVVFTVCLWWGPGSLRMREVVGGAVGNAAKREFAGHVVIAAAVVGVVVLGAALVGAGPSWSPAAGAPWDSGVLAGVARLLGGG